MPIYKTIALVMPDGQTATKRFIPNNIYHLHSPPIKIALSILEQGLEFDEKVELQYSEEKGFSWLSKLARDLDGQVSRMTIDEYLDTLTDGRLIRPPPEVMQRVEDVDGSKWVRAYYIGNEYVEDLIGIYKSSHEVEDVLDLNAYLVSLDSVGWYDREAGHVFV